MLTMRPPPPRCITGTTARHIRNIEATLTSITLRHSSSGISVNGRIAREAYSPALLTRTSIDPHRSATSATSDSTPASSATSAVRPMPSGNSSAAASAPWRSAITMRAPPAARPWAIALPMPCDPPVTIATLPSSSPIVLLNRRERRRRQDPVLLRVDERLDLPHERFPVVARLERGPALLALREAVVAPHAGVGRHGADLRREGTDEAAEHLLLNLDAFLLVQLHELGQLARVDVVVALLDDDHGDLSGK